MKKQTQASSALILDPAVATAYRKVWESTSKRLAAQTRYPWAQERAGHLLLLHPVEVAMPLGRAFVRVILGDQAEAVAALAHDLKLDYLPVESGNLKGIALTTCHYLPLVLAWDGPASF